MAIISAEFIKGTTSAADVFTDSTPQIAFLGRSNVGKSSTINLLTEKKGLAKTSSFPGRTQQINVFLINDSFHLIDLPGYGYAKTSLEQKKKMGALITHYLRMADERLQKIVLIIDALVGPTKDDLAFLEAMRTTGKTIIIAANKIDKIKKSIRKKELDKLKSLFNSHVVVPYSVETKEGSIELREVVFASIA